MNKILLAEILTYYQNYDINLIPQSLMNREKSRWLIYVLLYHTSLNPHIVISEYLPIQMYQGPMYYNRCLTNEVRWYQFCISQIRHSYYRLCYPFHRLLCPG
jgi:hypothetical protein